MERIIDGDVVWRPSAEQVEQSLLMGLIRRFGATDYEDLNARAEADPAAFWDGLLAYLEMRFYRPYDAMMDQSPGKPWTRWCVGGTTNAYLNCIEKHKDTPVWDMTYIDWEGEDGRRRTLSYRQFDEAANRLAAALRRLGVQAGDPVGLFLPMIPEVFVAFFACAKIGAVNMPMFSGFGPVPVAVRINEAPARVVITADGTWRRGEAAPIKAVLDEAAGETPGLEAVVVVDHMDGAVPLPMTPGRDQLWRDLVAGPAPHVDTEELPAEAPLTLAYTSGTSGQPKGIIQTHVGFVTKIALDIGLTTDFRQSDGFFWLSDFGWMVGALAAVAPSFFGGRLIIAEGAPDHPDRDRFWRLIETCRVTHFGMAPTAARVVMGYGDDLVERHDLSSLKVLLTAGEPATPDAWHWVFDVVGKRKLPIINVSGGTEIGCSIVTGTVIHPQKPCAFNGPSLGSGAAVFDEDGAPVEPGALGELVMRAPSIALTKGFWGEGGKERYLETYWSDYPDVWRHGDFASIDGDGFWYLLGRSDDTIKVAGKRTGPAEIEALILATDRVADAAVIGLPDAKTGSAVAVIAIPRDQAAPDDALRAVLSAAVETGMGRSYRPREIHFVPDLPRTRSMKVMRRVIRSVLLDQPAGDLSSLVNPETLDHLRVIREARRPG